jgi:hypothetical protein
MFNTPPIFKYLTFDFFVIKFNHSYYLKYENKYIFKIYYVINHIIAKIKIIPDFLIRRVVKIIIEKVKYLIFENKGSSWYNQVLLKEGIDTIFIYFYIFISGIYFPK